MPEVRVRCPSCGESAKFSFEDEVQIHSAFGPDLACKRCGSVWKIRLVRHRKLPEVLFASRDIALSKKLARSTDPFTSHQAAAEIVPYLGRLHQRTLFLIEQNPDLSVKELAQVAGDDDNRRVGRRVSELKDKGMVYVQSTRECSVTGKLVEVYAVVPEAYKAYTDKGGS